MLRRVLIAFTSRPPIIQYLAAAFRRRGIEARGLYADDNPAFDRHFIHRVNKLAHNLRIFPKSRHLFENHPLSHMNYRSARLRDAIAEWDPDLVFMIRGLGFRSWAFERARKKFCWWVEADERVGEALQEVALYDHYFFINSSSVETARAAGFRHTSYLAHAVDASAFRPLGLRKDFDFAFVGLWSEKRQRYIEAAIEVSRNGAVYGPKWWYKTFSPARRLIRGRYIAGEALVRLYNGTKVVLNITNWGAGGGAARSGMTMRLFEVPATGSLLLTDHSVEVTAALTPGEHLETFSDLDEFQQKLAHHLADEAARERIAAQGRAYVAANCSYDQTVDRICRAYTELGR